MPKLITYSLKLDRPDSGDYYADIAAFAAAWQHEATQETASLIDGIRQYRLAHGLSDRSDGEYAFELLTIGVLLSEHRAGIARMTAFTRAVLKQLVGIQKRWPRTEKMIKHLRGWTAALARLLTPSRPAALPDLPDLLDWLRANEENGKAGRLAQWQGFLDETSISQLLALAGRFAEVSQAALGKYTAQVPVYLKKTAPKHRWQYDADFVARTRPEYHLGMLGTEVLNHAFRQRFAQSSKRVVIVPPCMRIQPEELCKAVSTPFGARCQACTPACRVHQLTRLGDKKGFDVFIMPDELRVFTAGEAGGVPGSAGLVGVVGVSCALTNWSGGWDVGDLNVPAQGLLLDYPGCSYHWDKKGIPTDINLKQLEELLK